MPLDPIPHEDGIERFADNATDMVVHRFSAFNADVALQGFGERAACDSALDAARAACRAQERPFSRTLPHSDVARLNRTAGQPATIAPETTDALNRDATRFLPLRPSSAGRLPPVRQPLRSCVFAMSIPKTLHRTRFQGLSAPVSAFSQGIPALRATDADVAPRAGFLAWVQPPLCPSLARNANIASVLGKAALRNAFAIGGAGTRCAHPFGPRRRTTAVRR